jgi:hypothetical protein
MSERTTVRLPEELLRRAKRKAAAEGRTLTALIEEGLRRVTADRRQTKPATRSMPPVSTARGGLRPGFDWDKLSAQAQEIDDLEYLARMKRSE